MSNILLVSLIPSKFTNIFNITQFMKKNAFFVGIWAKKARPLFFIARPILNAILKIGVA